MKICMRLRNMFGNVRLKTHILILVCLLISFGCAARQPIAPEMTVDMAIDKLASELTQSMALQERPKIAIVDLLGPNDNHTQLGSFISDKLITKLFMSGRFEKVLERSLLWDLLVQQRIEIEGYFDEDTVKSICGKIGIDAMVKGFITDWGSKVDVNIRLIDMNTEILSVGEAQIDKNQMVNSKLQNVKKATLTVAVNPSDVEASVTVGEKRVKSIGGIAIFRDLPQGNRSIIVTAKGCPMVQRSVYIEHDKAITISLTPRVTPPPLLPKSEFFECKDGTFMMGSLADEKDHDEDEIQKEVSIEKMGYMQATEVTQGQWESVMKDNPCVGKPHVQVGPDFPVVYVSWHDVQEFIKKLNNNDPNYKYRLPSEAEWEYACRAGSTTKFRWGNKVDCSKANFGSAFSRGECNGEKPAGRMMRVRSFEPNAWGLYDMHGNVWEWCQDTYDDYKGHGPKGTWKVTRGGAWHNKPALCRSANRGGLSPDERRYDQGFRLVKEEK